jgi:osmoprotectant transport system substrate-binding protein
MMKKLLVIFVLLLAGGALLFAGGQQEADMEEAPEEEMGAEEGMEEEPTGPPKSGIAYKAPIDIGTKNFTEQFVVGNLMAIYLEDQGFDVSLKTGMSSSVMREAMENGDVDLCMDYTGTLWLSYAGHEFKGESPKEMYQKAKEYDAKNGLIWLDPIWCNNTYAIAVTSEFSEENGITTMSEFAEYVREQEGEVPFASDFEFYSRPDGILGLQLHYDFAFKPDAVKTVLPGLTFEYLAEGRAEACMIFGTDPAAIKYDWVVLEDDKNFWPPYDLCPYSRVEVLEANDGLREALNRLVGAFPDDAAGARKEMTELNAMVDIDLMEPEEAAEQWLQEKGLID